MQLNLNIRTMLKIKLKKVIVQFENKLKSLLYKAFRNR